MNTTQSTEITMTDRFDARREQMLRELASDLADLVRTGVWHASSNKDQA